MTSPVALIPAGNPAARSHYRDTIDEQYDLSLIREHLSASEWAELGKVAPSGRSFVWGVVAGNNTSKWAKLEPGSVCAFNRSGQLLHSAVVTHCLRNPDAAREIWGVDGEGRPWECMFFMEDRRPIDRPWDELRSLLGYGEGDRLMGFRVLNEGLSQKALEYLGRTGRPAVTAEEVFAAVRAGLAAESTDAESFARRRKEQGALREYLLGGRDYGTCICCGEKLPASLLVAAHLKKRSDCSEAERLDFENVAALMCVLGCDAVYERGMLTADDDGWQWSSFTPNAVRDRIRPATGVEFLTEGNRQYFEAHRRSHT